MQVRYTPNQHSAAMVCSAAAAADRYSVHVPADRPAQHYTARIIPAAPVRIFRLGKEDRLAEIGRAGRLRRRGRADSRFEHDAVLWLNVTENQCIALFRVLAKDSSQMLHSGLNTNAG